MEVSGPTNQPTINKVNGKASDDAPNKAADSKETSETDEMNPKQKKIVDEIRKLAKNNKLSEKSDRVTVSERARKLARLKQLYLSAQKEDKALQVKSENTPLVVSSTAGKQDVDVINKMLQVKEAEDKASSEPVNKETKKTETKVLKPLEGTPSPQTFDEISSGPTEPNPI